MRRTVLVALTAFALGGFTVFTGFTPNARAEGASPKLDEALVHLRYALAALHAAPADPDGHRAKALELTQAALEQVNQGIASGAKH